MFQSNMNIHFHGFSNVLIYIDNIILFTKKSFGHYVLCLQKVHNVLNVNITRVHAEQLFLTKETSELFRLYHHALRYKAVSKENCSATCNASSKRLKIIANLY